MKYEVEVMALTLTTVQVTANSKEKAEQAALDIQSVVSVRSVKEIQDET